MLLDKLPWCSHQGDPIFSIHVHPNGSRFATAGADNTVRVWALPPALDARQENNPGAHKLLATATDHNGPVNVVRFSHSGAALASGSDDGVACVYELRAGAGGGVLGGESNIENWRIKHILRGHESHVVDLGWSPDDALIATASLDSTAAVWDVATGNRIATLRAHSSFVKGVAWDPVGTYLATLSEDRSVAVWRREDWSLVATITKPFEQMVTATFACRLAWSPDGRLLLAGNSFQGATHSAVAVPREAWDRPEEYLLVCGHGGAVVATAFAPNLFHVPPLGGGPPGEDLSAVFAIGGQDKRVTVWASSADRPIFCGSRLFKSQVLDLAWTPDGEALLASSSDGTVACLQFERAELGEPATKKDMEDVMKALYGSATGRTARRAIVESAEQLELEAAAAPAPAAKRQVLKPVAPQRQQAAPVAVQQAAPAPAVTAAAPAAADPLAALDARLGGSAAVGAVTQTGFDESSAAPAAAAAVTAAAPRPTDTQLMPPPAPRPPAGPAPAPKRLRVDIVPAAGAAQPSAAAATLRLAPLHPAPRLRVVLGPAPPLLSSGPYDTDSPSLELHVANKEARPGAAAHAEVSLTQGDAALWSDAVAGAVVAAAGTPAFTALATADGCLLMYTPAGRRMAPPLRLGAGVALLAAAGGGADRPGASSRVLALTTAGRLKLLDVLELREVMEADVVPLLESGAGILDARLSKATGVPVVTLTDSSAYVWHEGLRAWLRVADDTLASSRFAPVPLVPGQGSLAEVQAEALASGSTPGRALRLGGAATEAALARGVAEGNLAAAEALGSAGEYRAWMTTYARALANAGDEPRLRELADSLLGPPPGAGDGTWAPTVLGMRKRRMLREVVLVEAARNRALGGLLQRCRQALDEVEAAEAGAA